MTLISQAMERLIMLRAQNISLDASTVLCATVLYMWEPKTMGTVILSYDSKVVCFPETITLGEVT